MTFSHTVFTLRGGVGWTPDEANKIGEAIEDTENLLLTHTHPFFPTSGGNLTEPLTMDQNKYYNVGNAYLSSGTADLANLATHEYYNGASWVGDGQAGGLLQATKDALYYYTHDTVPAHTQRFSVDATGKCTTTGRLFFGNLNMCTTDLAQGSDFSAYHPAGFYDCYAGANAPVASDWNFLISTPHVSAGPSYIWNMQLSTGFLKPSDLWFRATNDGNRNPAWQHIHSGPGVSGSLNYTYSLAAGAEVDKWIDLGRPYSFAIVQFNHPGETQAGSAGIVVFCTTNYLDTVGLGGCNIGTWQMRAWAREKYGWVTNGSNMGQWCFDSTNGLMGATEVVLSGNSLLIRYHNFSGSTTSVNSNIYYRAFG